MRMPLEPPATLPPYSESQEEAKHPGAMLGLIMGMYPAIFIVGLLLAVGIMSIRNMSPSPPPLPEPAEVDTAPQTTTTNRSSEKEINSP